MFLNFFVNKVEDIRASITTPLVSLCTSVAPVSTWSSFSPVSLQDIQDLVRKMKPTSSPVDIIPTSLLLNVFDEVGPWLVKLINLSLKSGTVSSYFKHALVNPILKKPNLDPGQPINYRPISKLPFMSKMMEKVVAKQLTSIMEDNDLYDKYQSGFRSIHSTETALVKVSSDVMMAADSGRYTVLTLLDLTSAFDTVDHNTLIHRLKSEMGFSGAVLQWFASYINGRTFNVAFNDVMSNVSTLSCGVPQGSVLGPVLFLLYLMPLGRLIRGFKNVSYHFYADDIQLYCSFNDSEFHFLPEFLDCISCIKNWFSSNYLHINPNKTETLIIAPDKKIPLIKNSLGDLGSSVKSSIRNLGVVFNQSMSLEGHCRQLTKNCFYHLRNISKVRHLLSKPDLELVIHAFISSRIDYCNSVFTCFNKSTLCKLQMVQNAAARLLTGTSRTSHITPILSSLHWLPVNFRIEYKILVLTFRALHGQAPLYISDMLCPYTSGRSLRSSGQGLLRFPKTKFKTRGDLAFQAAAPRLWNGLPQSLREMNCVDTFKKHLKTSLFKKAFS
uniref:Reverse transcriptase domain-containing protein n=1 Tax=Gouania willdenowi TaxID=441366 RepID=A0A8C5GQG5_GOUWI